MMGFVGSFPSNAMYYIPYTLYTMYYILYTILGSLCLNGLCGRLGLYSGLLGRHGCWVKDRPLAAVCRLHVPAGQPGASSG